MSRRSFFDSAILLCAAALFSGGCVAPQAQYDLGALRPGSDEEIRVIAEEPMAYLRQAERRCAPLDQYRVTFHRQERLGLIPRLAELERMDAVYRARPLSVKFTWLDADSEYREALYVEGQHEDKVCLLPRNGMFGLPPVVSRFRPEDAMAFGKARNSIKDFGVHRMLVRTLKRINDARSLGDVSLKYVGRRDLESIDVYHFEARYPQRDPYPNKRQDLFFEVARGLPVGTMLWLPSDELDALYFYLNLTTPSAPFGDDVFTISGPAQAGERRRDGLPRISRHA
ncbi:MAG: DUF1571 domain-containing protein [Phycisphaerae bacterium]|nr:DUF1571 domain-containing protein [Phycisphaerae bacterium]